MNETEMWFKKAIERQKEIARLIQRVRELEHKNKVLKATLKDSLDALEAYRNYLARPGAEGALVREAILDYRKLLED